MEVKVCPKACKVAEALLGDDSETPVNVVADAVLQFRAEVGRDRVGMDELQAFSDGEEVPTATPSTLTVSALKEMLLVRGSTGTRGLTKAALLAYLDTGVKPLKPAREAKPGKVEHVRARCRRLGLRGYSAMGRPELEAWLHAVDTYGLAEAMTRKPAKPPPKARRAAALRAEAQAAHPTVKGLSVASKARLEALKATGTLPPPPARTKGGELTTDACRKVLRAARTAGKQIPAYSKLPAAEFRTLVAKLNLA